MVARLQLVEQRRKRALGHQFEEKLHFIFRRRGHDRIRALDALSVGLDSQSGVLARNKMELTSTADAKHPQIGSEIDALGYLRAVKFFLGSCHSLLALAIEILSQIIRSAQSIGHGDA